MKEIKGIILMTPLSLLCVYGLILWGIEEGNFLEVIATGVAVILILAFFYGIYLITD